MSIRNQSDLDLATAYTRAYNRWIVDFCSDSNGRLIPIAHICLTTGEAAAQELERAVKAGAKGAFVSPYTLTDKAHGHTDHDPFWAAAQDLDVPIGIHPVAEPPKRRVYQRFREMYKWGECVGLGAEVGRRVCPAGAINGRAV